jgi:hypothetical protein
MKYLILENLIFFNCALSLAIITINLIAFLLYEGIIK